MNPADCHRCFVCGGGNGTLVEKESGWYHEGCWTFATEATRNLRLTAEVLGLISESFSREDAAVVPLTDGGRE